MFFDLSRELLPRYQSAQQDPHDFDRFWSETIARARQQASPAVITRIPTALTTIDVYDVTFSGFDGNPIKAWLRVPSGANGPLPTVVHFVGYGGGRGHPLDNLLWASAGFAGLHMDTRGQGSTWSTGDTSDPAGAGAQYPGFMTRGIASPETYYYRRLITDAVRAIDTARELELVDASRLAVFGQSQGGGLALACAGLVPELSAAACCVPFLCDFPRACVITDEFPYKEIGKYLAVHRDQADSVHEVLSYFDGVNFAARAHAPARFSTSLMDTTCPPSTVYAAFNRYAGSKKITLWEYNGHEGGQIIDQAQSISFFQEVFGS